MEGGGLYAAATNFGTPWILIKAICDGADGTKKFRKQERQSLAAKNAADFVVSLIAQGGWRKLA